MNRLLLASLFTLAAASGPVLAADAMSRKSAALPQNQCFRSHDIQNHTFADDHQTMYLNVDGAGAKRTYRVTMSNRCMDGSTSTDPLVIKETTGSSLICAPIDFDVGVHSMSGFSSHCIVSGIALMTPAEVAALPKKVKP